MVSMPSLSLEHHETFDHPCRWPIYLKCPQRDVLRLGLLQDLPEEADSLWLNPAVMSMNARYRPSKSDQDWTFYALMWMPATKVLRRAD